MLVKKVGFCMLESICLDYFLLKNKKKKDWDRNLNVSARLHYPVPLLIKTAERGINCAAGCCAITWSLFSQRVSLLNKEMTVNLIFFLVPLKSQNQKAWADEGNDWAFLSIDFKTLSGEKWTGNSYHENMELIS